jgi:hypothetical protein
MFTEDRTFRVPAGAIVKTGYAPIHKIKMACRARMAVGDVDRAYQKRLQLGSDQPFPPPNGYWEGDTFVVRDGRHQYIARLMLGLSHLFVAWIEEPATDANV